MKPRQREDKKMGIGHGWEAAETVEAAVNNILSVQTEEHRQRLSIFVNTLPSYTQTHGGLSQGNGRFCCLGVACEMAIAGGAPVVKEAPPVIAPAGMWWWHYVGPDRQMSTTALVDVVSDFYGLRNTGGAPYHDPLLLIPPTINIHRKGSRITHTRAAVANDDLGLNFDQIAECFEYTYLRGDWNAKHPEANVGKVKDDDVAAG